MNEIRSKIESFIRRYVKSDKLEDSDDIFSKGLVNSLFAMQLVLYIEQEFSIAVDNDVLGTDRFNSINSICHYVNEEVNGTAG